ncbi:hypothetical protein [Rathayibacter sp. Leaf248]|uniref:hypothetical protein n=1 Tax=Rathayibacter sp. Leaf248 TaxID=2876555 RepID=UPI001E3F89E7|nr:hypothetical protein [Rathayibacter sp. Leaf248]
MTLTDIWSSSYLLLMIFLLALFTVLVVVTIMVGLAARASLRAHRDLTLLKTALLTSGEEGEGSRPSS